MPELPEVETVVNELRDQILDQNIQDLIEVRPRTVNFHTIKPAEKLGQICRIDRRGKYIQIFTSSHLILIHLRMTGKLLKLEPDHELPSHTRAYFVFTDKSKLAFDDIRTFGTIDIYPCNYCPPKIQKQGIEPLGNKFTGIALQKLLANRKAPIKTVLLNQGLIAGLGNIYAIEALYRARIDPQTPASQLSREQYLVLAKNIKQVLKAAIKHNGTSVSDYRRVDDKTGDFQNFLQVYQKDNCPRGHAVKRIKQAGRSTFYCPFCQK